MLLILTSINIIIKDLEKKNSKYSEKAETAFVRPIFKENKRNKQDKKL